MYARIKATGSYSPDFELTNDMLTKYMDTSDEWITTRTGIRSRRIAQGEGTADMAVKAAKIALDNAGAEDVDLVIGCSVTQDNLFPSLACEVQGRLGLHGAAFDVAAGCSGFVYGMDMAKLYIESGHASRVLIVAAESLSRAVDYADRSTCVLFGDGAAAVVLEADNERGILSSYISSDGTGACHLVSNLFETGVSFGEDTIQNSTLSDKRFLYMNGKEVFKFATRALSESIEKALEQTEYGVSQLDWLFVHQANRRIIDYAIEKYNLDPTKVPINIDRFGNTSSVSIPLLLDELHRDGRLKRGQLIAFSAFGAGLTCGANIIRW